MHGLNATRLFGVLFAAALLSACGGHHSSGGGGGSGPPPDKALGDLSTSEWSELCTYVANVEHGGTQVSCDDGGVTVTFETAAECESQTSHFAGCTATVAQSESCAQTLAADPCDTMSTGPDPDCVALAACVSATFDAGSAELPDAGTGG